MRLCQLLFDKKMRVFVADGEDFDARLTQLDSTWNTAVHWSTLLIGEKSASIFEVSAVNHLQVLEVRPTLVFIGAAGDRLDKI